MHNNPGACLGHFNIDIVNIFIQPMLTYIVVAISCISGIINHSSCRKVLNRIGALTSGFVFIFGRSWGFDPDGVDGTPFVVQRLYDLIFFLLLEVDRVNGDANMEEAQHLRSGFSGSIVQATCSRDVDAERIFAEIGEKTADVDYAIHVLLSAGMSSPTLRAVAKRSIDIRGAGHAEIAFPFLALVPLTLETAWSIYGDFVHNNDVYLRVAPFWLIHSITVAARVGLLILLWRSPRDERCFILKMICKMVAVYLILYCSLHAVWTSQQSIVAQFQHWFVLPLTAYTSMLGLACT